MILFPVNTDKRTREIILLCTCILLFIFRTAIPWIKYPFLAIYPVFFFYSVYGNRKSLKSVFLQFVHYFLLSLFIFIIIIFSLFNSYKLPLIILQDLLNTSIIISFFFLLALYIQNINNYSEFKALLIKIIYIFSIIIAVIIVLRFYYSLKGIELFFFLSKTEHIDYNFSLLPVFFGLILIVDKIKMPLSRGERIWKNVFLFLFSGTILISGSRRGIVILLILVAYLVVIQIIYLITRKSNLKNLALKTRFYLISSFTILLLVFISIFYTSSKTKINMLRFFGVENSQQTRVEITEKVLRYLSAFKSDISFQNLYHTIWLKYSDPRYPESGWGSRIYQSVYPLTGKNVEIVPEGAHGYLMDNRSDANTWSGNAYSYSSIKNFDVVPGDSIIFSAFCFVSSDFDGEWANISVEGAHTENSDYDFNKKNTWQKLEIKALARKAGELNSRLFWSKYNAVNFDSLKGYIIYAYPEIQVVKNKGNIDNELYEKIINLEFDPRHPETGWAKRRYKLIYPLTGTNVKEVPKGAYGYMMDKSSNATIWGGNAYSYSQIKSISVLPGDNAKFSVYCYVSDDFNGEWAQIRISGASNVNADYNLANKGIWQKLEINQLIRSQGELDFLLYWSKYNSHSFDSLNGFVIYAYPEITVESQKLKASDPLYSKIINQEFDSRHPETGWGKRKYKLVFPLYGKNVGIVPGGTYGYMMDKTTNASTWNGNAYSFSEIRSLIAVPGDSIHFSAYCYISENFNGSWAQILLDGPVKYYDDFDFSSKGQWQKLEINTLIRKKGEVKAFLYWAKNKTTSFNNLNGQIIYAYPSIEIHRQALNLKDTLNQNILNLKFDSRHPGTGWGSPKYSLVYPLTGENVRIIPKGSYGCKMDSSANSNTWNGNAYSFTEVKVQNVSEGDSIKFSVYCYVSDNFNGEWAQIRTEGIKRVVSNYDLKKIGQWQRLEIKIKAQKNGELTSYLAWAKYNAGNFKSLKGYVIFAYPHISIKKASALSLNQKPYRENFEKFNSSGSKAIYTNSSANYTSSKSTSIYTSSSSQVKFKSTRLNFQESAIGYPFICFIQNELSRKQFADTMKNNTLQRVFLRSDTIYHPYKSIIQIDTISNQAIAQRINRWQFAWQLYSKEYTTTQKIEGGGFNYVSWFGHYFNKGDDTKSDYPHNPILSVLLYSGILGLMLYLYLLFQVFYLYYIYRKEIGIFSLFFLITFFFSFFSANSPFDPPVMGFFILFPYFVHYVVKKPIFSIKALISRVFKTITK
jgi:hypothetical protein